MSKKIEIDKIISTNTYTQWVCLGNEYIHTTLAQTCPKDSKLALWFPTSNLKIQFGNQILTFIIIWMGASCSPCLKLAFKLFFYLCYNLDCEPKAKGATSQPFFTLSLIYYYMCGS